jgi:gamma-glutamyltranspeptidase/glutathione hydrolase
MMAGMIAAGSPHTARAGADILEAGGNAVDAAVAATFASMVAEASISSIGGGGFAILQRQNTTPTIYDFFVAMPGYGDNIPPQTRAGDPINDPQADFKAVPVLFADKQDTYYVGRASTAVPGNPAGLARLLQDAGTMPLHVVLQPAIDLARNGYAIPEKQVEIAKTIEAVVRYTRDSDALFARDGEFIQEGMRFRNPDFATSLEILARDGIEAFYEGELADAIVADHAKHGGLLTHADLRAYKVLLRQPIHVTYRGHDIYTNPPPAAGGILIAYALRLLEQADLQNVAYHSPEHIRLWAEIMRQANHLRQTDDPANSEKWQAVLSDARIQHDWQVIVQRFQASHAPQNDLPETSNAPHGKSRSTTHISVVDKDGLAIAISTTPGATGGYVVGETGMLMNNILGETDLNPAGFHQMPVGARLGSMMSPTIINLPDGGRASLGSAGSSRIRSAILQTISRLIDWQMPLSKVINQARVHFENDSLELEYGYKTPTADALEALGYDVNRWTVTNLYFGGAHIAYRSSDGELLGAGDHRRGGAVMLVN